MSISSQGVELISQNKVVGYFPLENIENMYVLVGGARYRGDLLNVKKLKRSGNYYVYFSVINLSKGSICWPRELITGDYAHVPNVFYESDDRSFSEVAKAYYENSLGVK